MDRIQLAQEKVRLRDFVIFVTVGTPDFYSGDLGFRPCPTDPRGPGCDLL